MTFNRHRRLASAALLTGTLALPGMALAQQASPSQSFGLSTGLRYNDNRGLDTPSQGDTTELFTRFDFGLVFATPLQSLSLNGDITLRGLDGAEAGSISDGLTDPNVRLRYNRAVRNSQLTVSAFAQETETSTLIPELDGLDLVVVNDNATRLSYGYDATLELRREAPFGITLSTGYTGLRYSDTTSTTLLDQDRFRVGVGFRFDINPVLRADVTTRYSTFEEEGTPGTRETYALNASLTRSLPAGSVGVRTGVTSVEEGERYSLSVTHSFERPLWQFGGSLGIEQGVNGDNFAIGSLNIGHELPNGSLTFGLNRSVRSGLEDNEQDFTSVRFGYTQQLSPDSSLGLNAAYSETSPTAGTGSTTSLASIGVNYQRALAPGWQLNMGLSRRESTNSAGNTARDNSVSVSLRRELSARR
jgi:hypothetical protein